jgi:DNA polymerase I
MAVLPNFVAIDTESNGLNVWRGHRAFAAAAVWPSGAKKYWRGDLSGLRAVLEDETLDKVFHNAKHDLRMLEWGGFNIRGKVWDTMILGHLLDGREATTGGLSLDKMSIRFLPSNKRKVVDEIEKWFDDNKYGSKQRYGLFHELPPALLEKRCVGDTELTCDIFARLYPTVSTIFPFLLEQEHRLLHVVRRMEDRGVLIDYDEIEKQRDNFDRMIEDVTQWAEGVIGRESFSIASKADQILLLERGGCLNQIRDRTKTGQPKLDDAGLRSLHHPVAYMLMLGKTAIKMRGTFLGQMEDAAVNGVLHPSFNQVGTCTGRFSCSNPNLQNIPIEAQGGRSSYTSLERSESYDMTGMDYAPHLKRIFKCRTGYAHIHSDKKQAEMFTLGHYANDRKMLDLLNKCIDTDGSIHEEICMAVFGEVNKGLKTRTKVVIFGYLYGAGIARTARTMGASVAEATSIRNRLGRMFPGLPDCQKQWEKETRARGYVETVHGRRHYLGGDEAYIATSRVCQGTVGDEMKSRMIALDEFYAQHCPDAGIILNIHDDLGTQLPIEDAPRLAGDIKRIMEETSRPFRIRLPSSLDITYTCWSDLQEIADVNNIPLPASA